MGSTAAIELTVEAQSAAVCSEVQADEQEDPESAAEKGTYCQLLIGRRRAYVLRYALSMTSKRPIAMKIPTILEALTETDHEFEHRKWRAAPAHAQEHTCEGQSAR